MDIFDSEGLNLKDVYKDVKKVINDDIISFNTFEVINFNDEPKFPVLSVLSKSPFKFSDYKGNKNTNSSGISVKNKFEAEISAVAEAIERFSSNCFKLENMRFETYNNLKNSSLNIIDLSKFVNFKLSCNLEELNNIKFHWEKVYSILEKKYFYLPSQFIYNSFEEDEYYIRQPISTGASTWSSNSGAILGGIYEIIERDSFMIFYLNKLSPPRINLNEIENKEIKIILEKFKRYKLEVYILDITSDLNVPTFLTILIDKTGIGPAISVGNNTDFDINKAIKGSLLEAYKVRLWLRYKKTVFSINPEAKKEIETNFLLKRGFLWYDKKMINKINFFMKSDKISNLNKYKEKSKLSIVDSLKEVIQILSEKKYSVFIKDLTNNNFPIYNFKTFKVIVPELHPLYLREGFKYDTGKRLTEVPKILGYKTNGKINDFPHPFL